MICYALGLPGQDGDARATMLDLFCLMEVTATQPQRIPAAAYLSTLVSRVHTCFSAVLADNVR